MPIEVREANNICSSLKTAKGIVMRTKVTMAERVACMITGTALSIVGLILMAL
jgi:hypothetical protein